MYNSLFCDTMAGVLFIIYVPQKEHEAELQKETTEREKLGRIYGKHRNKEMGKSESYTQDKINNVISKSESTDCLSKNRDVNSKSEIILNVNDYMDGGRSYVKSSWEGMKQTFKLKKNKLNITGPVRGDDILDAFHWDTPLEIVLSEVVSRLAVKNATWSSSRNNKFWQVTFSLETGYLCEELLQVLRTFGIGTRQDSSVCVVPCALYYNCGTKEHESPDSGNCEKSNETNSPWSRFSSSVRARTNLAQVLHDVRADATLTFDWLFLLVAAGFVAAIGLLQNSTVIIVASMLISPLMGPITASTLGTAVRDRSLQYMGVVHELMGLLLCLVIGFIIGLAICAVGGRYGVIDDWPTSEMMARCELRSLFVGMLIALPSGACVALAVLSDYTSSLVGVAISASLLPPAVNAGLLWAMALFRLLVPKIELSWVVTSPTELAMLGTASLCLTLINIICIFVAGVAVYKIKAVRPLEKRDIAWWRDNKSRLQASRSGCRDKFAAWEIYSKWSNELPEDSKKHGQGMIQNDTVTFRKPSAMQRNTAESIEECFRKAKFDDSYRPLKPSATPEYEIQTKEEKRPHTTGSFSYYNFGYEATTTESPTIEPSQNFTMDPKRNAP